METRILRISQDHLWGKFSDKSLTKWMVLPSNHSAQLEEAAMLLRHKDVPVAFPTETVYGLGADATRSESVREIFKAKGRPSDNPLIVHVCDLTMLRSLLPSTTAKKHGVSGKDGDIPEIYKPLISRFWPGPLTILLPRPQPGHSPERQLAEEVTGGLDTFGARMPNSPLALSLISMADTPLAAPSANASTKPSPTMAQHVKDDLNGKIEFIIDGGSCQVGVESTVVDGLCQPPVVLRPGGIGIDELRECPGWEEVKDAYKDKPETDCTPRAPGMKYKHYSPRANVVLYEHAAAKVERPLIQSLEKEAGQGLVGIIRTGGWNTIDTYFEFMSSSVVNDSLFQHCVVEYAHPNFEGRVVDINLGSEPKLIAHGLFSALRYLDQQGATTIIVEGIDDKNDITTAVMNRLRKAASEIRS